MDQLSAENLFPDMLFAPHAPEYSHIDLTSSTAMPLGQRSQSDLSSYTMDTVFSSNPNKRESSIPQQLQSVYRT
jgi:hypothetical protein